jgi:HSP20 family molecular chaperone IbpA
MTRMSSFNSPFLIGFERLEQVAAHASKYASEGYPPHNIEQTGDNTLRITLAVAGFDVDDLDVGVVDNQLIVKGRKKEEDPNRVFLHRGIASRQFQRSWVLAEGLQVRGATLDNGLLHIDVQRVVPEPAVRSIMIAKAGPGNAAGSRGQAKAIDVGGQN